jgi:hypothetical protein
VTISFSRILLHGVGKAGFIREDTAENEIRLTKSCVDLNVKFLRNQ